MKNRDAESKNRLEEGLNNFISFDKKRREDNLNYATDYVHSALVTIERNWPSITSDRVHVKISLLAEDKLISKVTSVTEKFNVFRFGKKNFDASKISENNVQGLNDVYAKSKVRAFYLGVIKTTKHQKVYEWATVNLLAYSYKLSLKYYRSIGE
jgi:hypothetical protein